jgi:hypothetical protein
MYTPDTFLESMRFVDDEDRIVMFGREFVDIRRSMSSVINVMDYQICDNCSHYEFDTSSCGLLGIEVPSKFFCREFRDKCEIVVKSVEIDNDYKEEDEVG